MGRARSSPRTIARGVLTATLLALGGCSSTRAPSIDVADAFIDERTDEGVVVTFVLEAENTNNEPIPLREVTSTLRLSDGRTIRVRRLAEATVRRFGVQRFRVPMAIPLDPDRPAPGELTYELRGKVRWPPPGVLNELLFDIDIRRPSAPFSDRGRIDLASAAPAPPETGN